MPSGYVYTWTGKVSSSFGAAGNWFNSTTGTTASTAPGVNDEAIVSAAGAINGPGSVFELGLTGTGGGLSVGGTITAQYLFTGGSVSLASGGVLGASGLVDVGDNSAQNIAAHGAASLTVGAGGSLFASNTTTGGFDILVGQQGGTGTLNVSGYQAVANAGVDGFWAGNNGTGVINVTGGGQLYGGGQTGQYAGYIGLALGTGSGSGTATVTGAGSAGLFGNIVDVGYGGIGALTVSSQASFLAGDEQTSLVLGDSSSTASGSFTVSGASATLLGVVDDGSYGAGAFNIVSSTVTLASNASSGAAAVWSALLGVQSSGNGTLALTGSELIAQHGIAVGSDGRGTITSTNSTIIIQQAAGTGQTALAIGLGSGTQGNVSILGGVIDDNGKAGVIVGGYGSGTLSIGNSSGAGGQLVTGGGSGTGLIIGSAGGASGIVTVTGNNAALTVTDTVVVGGAGNGSLSVSAQAALTVGGAASGTALAVGENGGTGAVTLASTSVSFTGQVNVGDGSAGALTATSSVISITASGIPALVLGSDSGVSGSANLIGDALYLTGGLLIGNEGSGSMTLSAGAQATLANASGEASPSLIIGANAGSSGTLALTGYTTMTSATGVAVGVSGKGALTVASSTLTINTPAGTGLNAIAAGISAGSSGLVSITSGEINDQGQAGVLIGAAGNGTLTIGQSGTLLTGNPGGTSGLAIGVSSGGTGAVSVSGSYAVLSVNGAVIDGSAGTGSLTVANSGKFTAGTGTSSTGLALGNAGGTGFMSVSGAGTAQISGQTQIGANGSGTLSIAGGSSFTDTASGLEALLVANTASSTGSLLISDAGTSVHLAGGLEIGSSGTAQATIQNGAVVTASTWSGNGGDSVVIEALKGTGALTVTGAGTALNATGEFSVGGTLGSGAGTLTISSGATVSVALASGQSIEGATIGGTNAGALSVATVTGTGSEWSVAGILGVGQSGGAAMLSITNGGKIVAGALDIDTQQAGSHGTVSVSGTGATLTAATLTMGGGGNTGLLAIGPNGHVTITGAADITGSVTIVNGRLSTGALTVEQNSAITGHGVVTASSVVDLGQIGVTVGKLNFVGAISGTGSLTIGGHGELSVSRAVGSTIGIDFVSGGGTISATTAGILKGTIENWSAADHILLTTQNVASDSYANGTLTLFDASHASLGKLHFSGSLAAHNFSLSHPVSGETLISYHS